MATATKKKAYKAIPASSPRSKSQVIAECVTSTGLTRKQVVSVFDTLTQVMVADLGKKGCGTFKFLGFKMVAKTTPAKRGGEKKINPLTGKEYITKSKPASRKVRVRALKTFTQHIV